MPGVFKGFSNACLSRSRFLPRLFSRSRSLSRSCLLSRSRSVFPPGRFPVPGRFFAPGRFSAPRRFPVSGFFPAPGRFPVPGCFPAPGHFSSLGRFSAPGRFLGRVPFPARSFALSWLPVSAHLCMYIYIYIAPLAHPLHSAHFETDFNFFSLYLIPLDSQSCVKISLRSDEWCSNA